MVARSSGRPVWRRWNIRTALAWVWPTAPSTWSEVPGRLAPGAIQVARLTIAAVLSYVVADALFPGILDLTAPLTALLVVQASTVGTLLMGVVRVGAVLTGVLVAIGVTAYLGLSWWSLALVIAASLILAKLLRLGDQTLEAPISGMLILAVSTPGIAGEVRLANTLIGTVVGIAFSLVVPIAIPNAQAGSAARRVARSQAALLDEISHTVASRPPHAEEVVAWTEWGAHIAGELAAAEQAVVEARESRRLNPRALATATVHPGLSAAVARLARAHSAEQALVVAIGRQAPTDDQVADESDPIGTELRRAFAVALDNVASGLRSFGELVEAEYGRVRVDRVDGALELTLESVRETRAVLTELTLLDVDPRGRSDLWMLHGSVLTALEHLVAQLDVEQDQRSSEPWLGSRALPSLRSSVFGGWLRGR
ncbi:aromatic acid exporter family protein [Amnibacterium flavum]|uniref:FUSC family protein n=1 Tax=Amnibacterium flavum TaxID=2173173 RepID=A0A2V1HT66_9MICO|nr:aromatic acid exporter family protein [Amnibacterium flavum]PVZ95763.1 FUSC family protein [Amnibacterium flavum]